MRKSTRVLVFVAAVALIGCISSSDNTTKLLVGEWIGASPRKEGTMCLYLDYGNYRRECYKQIPWVRQDMHRFVFHSDGTGYDEYSYLRVNGEDSSESWTLKDSLTFTVTDNTLVLNTFKRKYEHDRDFQPTDVVTKYAYKHIGWDLYLDDYQLRDTGTAWSVDFKLVRLD